MKKTYPLLLLSASLFLAGCGANYLVNKGNTKFDAEAYADAVPIYNKAIEKKPLTIAKQKLADSYRLMNNPLKAEPIYKEVISDTAAAAINYFNYGKVLMQSGKYAEAKAAFETYAAKMPEDKIVKSLIEACANPKMFDNSLDTCAYAIKKIELSGLSSSFGASPYNFGYVFAADVPVEGKALRDKFNGGSFLDLYYSKKDQSSGKWSSPEPIKGGVNTEYHDAYATFSADAQTMYFTRTNESKGKLKKNKKNESTLRILKAVFLEGEWTNIEDFPYNSDEYSNSHPNLSRDGKMLFFSSDRPGGFGQSDIYVCLWDGSKWGEPTNLGAMVNTAGREVAPVFAFNEKLYFSSDGHAGMGGLDVFYTTKNGSNWAQPSNMKSPINSNKDDFSFVLNDDVKIGNVSSSRGSAESALASQDQMYEVVYKDPIIPVQVCVREKGTSKPYAGATVYAQNVATGVQDSAVTNSSGIANFKLAGEADYSINARSKQFFTNAIEVSTKGKPCSAIIVTCDESKFIELDPALADKEYGLGDIYYDYNKWDIRPDAMPILDNLVKLLNDNPDIKIELGSHTDCRGKDEYNQKLSENRAKSVVKYCTLRDIDPKRLTYKGYGESQPKETCVCESCTEEQHQTNRRTVFKVIK